MVHTSMNIPLITAAKQHKKRMILYSDLCIDLFVELQFSCGFVLSALLLLYLLSLPPLLFMCFLEGSQLGQEVRV